MPACTKSVPSSGKNKSLESWIWDATCFIPSSKDADEDNVCSPPLIFTKLLCDVFDGEISRIAAGVGSRKKAFQLAARDPKLVRFYPTLEKSHVCLS